jgi:ATP:ADP antiporter, AAA family
VFYVWFSVFNLFVTMVFWALMADRFSLEQSKRLFGVIAVGGTLGAIFGPWLASRSPSRSARPACCWWRCFPDAGDRRGLGRGALQPERAARRPRRRSGGAAGGGEHAHHRRQRLGGASAPSLRSPYLLGIAGYVLILAVMATFIYFTRLQMVAALGEDLDMRTTWFARIDLITQIATLVLQAVVAGT